MNNNEKVVHSWATLLFQPRHVRGSFYLVALGHDRY
jgi:hypothetical protein